MTLIAGCGAQRGAATGTTLRIWYSTDDPVERVWSQQLARRFEASHPHVRVQLTDYSFEDLNTKFQLALSTHHPPDLAYVTPRGPGIPAYLKGNYLLDLTAAARAHGWAARLQPGLLARYNAPFGYQGAPRGHVMAVPTALAAVGILYNKRLLAQLHLSVPATLAEFDAALARAKRAGYTPIGLGNEDGWLGDDWYLTLVNALMSPAALEPEQQLSPRFTFHQPPFLAAAATLQRWANHGYFTPNFGGVDAQEGVDLFFRGKTLFQLVSSSESSQIQANDKATHLPIDLFAFPRAGGGRVMATTGYLGWVVPSESRQRALATEFIDNLLTPSTAGFLLRQAVVPAMSAPNTHGATQWQESYLRALATSQRGIYIDAAPITNLNATMEANVQLLLQNYEPPQFLVKSLQEVYTSHGNRGSAARIDGEF
jgi:raffinose/stachyose/melibiose transport system substrate-binding protein